MPGLQALTQQNKPVINLCRQMVLNFLWQGLLDSCSPTSCCDKPKLLISSLSQSHQVTCSFFLDTWLHQVSISPQPLVYFPLLQAMMQMIRGDRLIYNNRTNYCCKNFSTEFVTLMSPPLRTCSMKACLTSHRTSQSCSVWDKSSWCKNRGNTCSDFLHQ